jgi:hypothetical protein
MYVTPLLDLLPDDFSKGISLAIVFVTIFVLEDTEFFIEYFFFGFNLKTIESLNFPSSSSDVVQK